MGGPTLDVSCERGHVACAPRVWLLALNSMFLGLSALSRAVVLSSLHGQMAFHTAGSPRGAVPSAEGHWGRCLLWAVVNSALITPGSGCPFLVLWGLSPGSGIAGPWGHSDCLTEGPAGRFHGPQLGGPHRMALPWGQDWSG